MISREEIQAFSGRLPLLMALKILNVPVLGDLALVSGKDREIVFWMVKVFQFPPFNLPLYNPFYFILDGSGMYGIAPAFTATPTSLVLLSCDPTIQPCQLWGRSGLDIST